METAFFSFFQIRLLLLLGKIPKVSLSCVSPGRLGKTYPNPCCLMTTTMRYQSHHTLGAPLAHVCGRFLAHLHWRSTKKPSEETKDLPPYSTKHEIQYLSISKCGKSLGKGRKTTSELLKMLLLIDVKDRLVIITRG